MALKAQPWDPLRIFLKVNYQLPQISDNIAMIGIELFACITVFLTILQGSDIFILGDGIAHNVIGRIAYTRQVQVHPEVHAL